MIRITVTDGENKLTQFELDWDFDAVIEEIVFAFPELQGAGEEESELSPEAAIRRGRGGS
jgi:hypothetical protein